MFTLDDVLDLLSDGYEYMVFDSNNMWVTDPDDLYDLGEDAVSFIEPGISDNGFPEILIYMA